MLCKICNAVTRQCFEGLVLAKYKIQYFYCTECEFLSTEKPFWLEEAYSSPIARIDIGILYRNLKLIEQVSVLLYFFFGKNAKILDYAGGYGILTRLFRDVGFEAFWQDKYASNIFSSEFNIEKHSEVIINCVTSFESFEHFVDPIVELETMLSYSKNIFFSTELLPHPIPTLDKWWYYVPITGQHISFYSEKTLKFIAKKFDLWFYTFNGMHFFSQEPHSEKIYSSLIKYSNPLFHFYVKKKLRSLLASDFDCILTATKIEMEKDQFILNRE